MRKASIVSKLWLFWIWTSENDLLEAVPFSDATHAVPVSQVVKMVSGVSTGQQPRKAEQQKYRLKLGREEAFKAY